jgi:lipoyl(octanoyl) transferase
MEKNTFELSHWRLILSPHPSHGAWNMAVDEAILEQVESGKSPSTLRLYAWDPPCVTIGYAQTIEDIDDSSLIKLGWDLVRRPTGGRAILHTDELTYSVVGLSNDPRLTGSVIESYHRLAQALLRSLDVMDIFAEASENAGILTTKTNPVCFEVPSKYEITVDGKKLVGSAQARRRTAVIQHGTLPLKGDLTRIIQGLKFAHESDRRQATERLLQHATTIEWISGKLITWDHAAQAFIQGFEEMLNLNLVESGLSSEEISLAEKLVDEKYANNQWIRRL